VYVTRTKLRIVKKKHKHETLYKSRLVT